MKKRVFQAPRRGREGLFRPYASARELPVFSCTSRGRERVAAFIMISRSERPTSSALAAGHSQTSESWS